MEPDDERPLLLALDAPGLLHRSYHARAETGLRDSNGRPLWALHGMLVQALEAIESFRPAAAVFGFDDRTGSLRAQGYPAYKAGRPEKDPDLVDQLERASGLLDAIGLLTVTPAGLEADDVGASAATWAEQHGWRCVIVTSDRDAFAHISETTEVLRLIKGGLHGSPLLNPAKLETMYGVRAEDYLAFAALRGDASDNLPGVAGIGEKAAALLLAQTDSMQAVWADLEHTSGATVMAAIDAACEEAGQRRAGAGIVKRLQAPGARELYEFNVEIMAGHTDLDLGLTPDVPGSRGLLPVDAAIVEKVVGYLGVESTTTQAIRVLGAAGAETP